MKKIISAAFAAALCVTAAAQTNTVVYSLPSTVLSFDVSGVQETFYAGPYASYAAKYLGIEVRVEDETSCQITKIVMTPYLEADQSARYRLDLPEKAEDAIFTLSSQGLISFTDGSLGKESVWRFPAGGRSDFAERGVSRPYSSVHQNMMVEKSTEKRAEEAAEMIFTLREKKLQIVTGDTDATYSGEAMGAAIEELTRLEKEYLSLFTGYSEFKDVQMHYDLVPEKGGDQSYVVFRVSAEGGLVGADDLSGSPVILKLEAREIADAGVAEKPAKGSFVTIRIPAVCNARLYKGSELLLQSRVPVYQLGVESYYPVK